MESGVSDDLVASGDYMGRSGAVVLACQIEAYWRARGHEIKVVLVEAGFHPAVRTARFDIRSDLINGMPVGGDEELKVRTSSDRPLTEFYTPCSAP